jgi:polyisoprenoid-binding protein YceI
MTTTTAPAGTAVWKLDPTHTHVEFAVRHLMISKVKGHFSEVEGTLRTRGEDLAKAQLHVEIGAASVDTRVEQRDDHLRSPDFLDAERFPSLTFKSTGVSRTGKDRLSVTGDLTIRDVTREVTLDVTEHGTVRDPWGGDRAGFAARAEIDRKDFGLTWNQALEAGGFLVGDTVEILLEAELLLQSE